MEVNNISTQNNLNNLNNVSSGNIERLATATSITKAADDASSLLISDALESQRSELAQSVQNLNEGIAMSQIAESGLMEQKNILESIREKTLQAMNATTSAEGRDAIKNEIQKSINQFNMIAQQTRYNDQELLNQTGGNNTISISTSTSAYNINVADTTSVTGRMDGLLDNFTFEDMGKMLEAVDQGMRDIDTFSSDYASTSVAMESSARNTISEQINLSRANSALRDVDFGAEITDFNKTNVIAQVGYMVAAQANVIQDQSIKLLT